MSGGCVIGPGENPLRPGEVAIRIGRCMVCKKPQPFGLNPIYVVNKEDAKYGTPYPTDYMAGELCSRHVGLAVGRI